MRHLMTWQDGEDYDESGAHHLAHARACLGILLDAEDVGKLVDDRPQVGGSSRLLRQFSNQSAPVTANPTEAQLELDDLKHRGEILLKNPGAPDGPGMLAEMARRNMLGETNPFLEDLAGAARDSDMDTPNVRVTNIETSTPRCYLAGPMTGYENFNFPAFDEGQEMLEEAGFDVISPANLDRMHGIDPSKPGMEEEVAAFTIEDLKKIIRRDVSAILSLDPERGDRIAVLPLWELSTGSVAEVMLARWLGLPIMDVRGELLEGVNVNYSDICTAIYEYITGKAGMR